MAHLHTRLSAFRPAIALLLTAILLGGCSPRPAEPLRIGLNPWPGYDFLYLAERKGFIAEEGGRVEIVEFTSLGDSRRAFERGQLDAFGGTTVELLLARANSDREPRAFYVTNWSEGADQILARRGIDSIAGLRGKRVAVEPASLNLLVLDVALERAGLPYDAVNRVTMAQTEMPAAMAEGEVDAAVTYPPVSVRIRRESGARAVFDTSQAPRTVLDLFIAAKPALRQRPDDFRALVRAFDRAVAYARAHPTESRRIMARREGIPPEELTATLDRIRIMGLAEQEALWTPDGAVITTLGRTSRALQAAGHIDSAGEAQALAHPEVVQGAARP
jgi:NitT/TauT family transport system substrate-binding protein